MLSTKEKKIVPLRWNEELEKAEEWLWAWIVLLSGCYFDRLNIASFAWNHYPSNARVTSIGELYDRSMQAKYTMLKIVQSELMNRSLADKRKKAIVQLF